MSEINNNLPPQMGGIEKKSRIQPKPMDEVIALPETECCSCPQCEITADRGVLGQSQIKRPEGVTSDTEFFMKNPELIEVCDKYFDKTFAALTKENDPEAYEKACVLTDGFRKELTN